MQNTERFVTSINTTGSRFLVNIFAQKPPCGLQAKKRSQLIAMLDSLPMPVMLTDKDFAISYANKASLEALKKVARHLPATADNIIGSTLAIFDKNLLQQCSLQSQSGNNIHHTELMLGGEWLSFSATMMKNARGEFDGAFIDWAIITNKPHNDVELFKGGVHGIFSHQSFPSPGYKHVRPVYFYLQP